MSRLPRLLREHLDGAARSLYDSIAHGRRADGPQLFRMLGDDGALEGPFGPLLLNPEVGSRLSALGEGLRYHGTLPAIVRELLILCVARDRRSEYEWYAHAAVAREVGLKVPVLDSLRRGETPAGLSTEAQTAMQIYASLRSWTAIPDDLYKAAVAAFGEAGVMEIVCLIHYYDALAALIATFHIGLPHGVSPQFRTL